MRIASYCGTYNAFMEIFHISGSCFTGQASFAVFLPAAKKFHPVNRCRYIPADCPAAQDRVPSDPADSSGKDPFCFFRVCQAQGIPDCIHFWDPPPDAVPQAFPHALRCGKNSMETFVLKQEKQEHRHDKIKKWNCFSCSFIRQLLDFLWNVIYTFSIDKEFL